MGQGTSAPTWVCCQSCTGRAGCPRVQWRSRAQRPSRRSVLSWSKEICHLSSKGGGCATTARQKYGDGDAMSSLHDTDELLMCGERKTLIQNGGACVSPVLQPRQPLLWPSLFAQTRRKIRIPCTDTVHSALRPICSNTTASTLQSRNRQVSPKSTQPAVAAVAEHT